MRRRDKQGGFTLIELLVVILIILVLAGLLLPALSKARLYARNSKAKSEARELAKAWDSYWDAYQTLPAAPFYMDDSKVAILLGRDAAANSNLVKFMDFPKNAETDGFYDPWKETYKVEFRSHGVTGSHTYRTRVYLANWKRCKL